MAPASHAPKEWPMTKVAMPAVCTHMPLAIIHFRPQRSLSAPVASWPIPLVWGMGQLATGALSDRWGRKWMIASGMWVQTAGIATFVIGHSFGAWLAGAILLGIGTALVYPTLLAAVSDVAHPDWRASAVGVYRLWRDSGYAIGAIAAGLLADAFNLPFAITAVAVLTFVSGMVVAGGMYETLPGRLKGSRLMSFRP